MDQHPSGNQLPVIRSYDSDYHDWKIGDTIAWAIDRDHGSWKIEAISNTSVYWHDDNSGMNWTSFDNLVRVKGGN